MRVAHVGNLVPTSGNGVEKALSEFAARLPGAGVKVEVWRFNRSASEVREHLIHNVTVFDLPTRGGVRSVVLGLPRVSRQFIADRQNHIDLVHLHSVFTGENVLVGRLLQKPYVLTPHGGYAPRPMGKRRLSKRLWLRLLENKLVDRAACVHAVSQPEAEELRREFPRARVSTVPNAVEVPPEDLTPTPPKPDGPLVFLGRLAIEQKGLDLLLLGFARYLQTAPNDPCRLVLAGPDFRSGRERLMLTARELGIEQRVSFAGMVTGKEKDDLLAGARAFLHTSRWEGMPLALLEALAAGCVPLVTPETNLADEIENYRAGIVVRGETEAIAAGFSRLQSLSVDDWQAMRARSRQLVREKLSWPATIQALVDLYRRAADFRTTTEPLTQPSRPLESQQVPGR